ncbi:MAG TPA: Gfo/Idh/MocA family oxidoreductase [Thermomicrobiales bacterium]|nr:Gfo/Idh/MocA family oxidoreductase [Thermomicrobiales bacterium]
MSTGSRPVGIGIIGAGVISEIYLKNTTGVFDNIRAIAVADLVAERAQVRAKEFGIDALTVDELITHPDVEIVVNLTIPAAHHGVAKQVIEAGKSVYNEKPLAINRDDARELVAIAKAKGVLIGGAPDTFLGGGLQTARKALEDGRIGTPVAATAHFLGRGMEMWHPDPHFFFQPGAGPLFDVGPYYLTALTSMLGPVAAVTGFARASFPERTVTAEGPKTGETIPVNTPTHIAGSLQFESGVIGSLIASFDVWETDERRTILTIYGSQGTLHLPDPNRFGGPVTLVREQTRETEALPLTHGYTENSRGIGVSDMARALRGDTEPARASGEMAAHVVDIMQSVLEAAESYSTVNLSTTMTRPAPLPAGG